MWIIAAIIIGLALTVVWLYNKLVQARNMVDEAWSGIDVQLKRRHDLVSPLIETVKGYAKHEKTAFENVANARVQTINAEAVKDKSEAENDLSKQIKTIFALAEAYPDLKASENFLKLQKNLVEIEDNIQYARRYYNGTVRDLNIRIEIFPSNMVAGIFSFKQRDFFEIEYATERQAPDVDFKSA